MIAAIRLERLRIEGLPLDVAALGTPEDCDVIEVVVGADQWTAFSFGMDMFRETVAFRTVKAFLVW